MKRSGDVWDGLSALLLAAACKHAYVITKYLTHQYLAENAICCLKNLIYFIVRQARIS